MADIESVHEAVLLLDYVKSSGFTATFGDIAAAERKEALERLVVAAAETFHCRRPPKDTGDGFFMTFDRELDAVKCAISVLQHLPLLNHGLPRPELTIHVRIGITFGQLIVDSKGERKGDAANLCARFESLRSEDFLPDEGGIMRTELEQMPYDRIFVSGEVYEGVREAVPLRYLGLMKPKDIRRRYEVFAVKWTAVSPIELPSFPSTASQLTPRDKYEGLRIPPLKQSTSTTDVVPHATASTRGQQQDRRNRQQGSAHSPGYFVEQILRSDKDGKFGCNLVDSGGFLLEDSDSEGVILIKPGGTFYEPCLEEVFRRITATCNIWQVRIFDGQTVLKHALFDKQYHTSTMLATGDLKLTSNDFSNIRACYDTPAFARKFGVPYQDNLVEPALALCERIGFDEIELTRRWETGRAENLFQNGRYDGLNKIGYQKNVFPISLPHPNAAPVRIVLNGFIPGYKRLFTEPSARVVAIHVSTPTSWAVIRDHVVGENSNPHKCRPASIRFDAAHKKLPLRPDDNLVNGQRNVCHCSATLLDGMNELLIWFDRQPDQTVVGRICDREGVPSHKLVNYIADSLWAVSWTTRNETIDRLICEVQHPRVKDELRAAAFERDKMIAWYAEKDELHPDAVRNNHSFRHFVENGLRLAVAGKQYYVHIVTKCLENLRDRLLLYEIVDTIDELVDNYQPSPSPAVRAEAYRIAASDLRFLHCPVYERELSAPELFKSQIIVELADESLQCALRTERNLIKDVQASSQLGQFTSHGHAVVAIQETPDWQEFAKESGAVNLQDHPVVSLILCGGRSTRMGSTIPKPILPFRNRLILSAVLETMQAAIGKDASTVFAAVGFRADLLRRALGKRIRCIEFEKTLGLGFRVATCLEVLRNHRGLVVVAYADMPMLSAEAIEELIATVKGQDTTFGVLITSQVSQLSGHVERDDRGEIKRITQKRLDPQHTATRQERDAGVYVFHNGEEFRNALLSVRNDNIRGEFMFADVIERLYEAGWRIVGVEEKADSARGINIASDLLFLASRMHRAGQLEAAEVRNELSRDYDLTIDEALDIPTLESRISNHSGPFYFFHWWDKSWA